MEVKITSRLDDSPAIVSSHESAAYRRMTRYVEMQVHAVQFFFFQVLLFVIAALELVMITCNTTTATIASTATVVATA
jgi:hypothetical protein